MKRVEKKLSKKHTQKYKFFFLLHNSFLFASSSRHQIRLRLENPGRRRRQRRRRRRRRRIGAPPAAAANVAATTAAAAAPCPPPFAFVTVAQHLRRQRGRSLRCKDHKRSLLLLLLLLLLRLHPERGALGAVGPSAFLLS